jgi:GT2 family glycosyltransferase
VDALPSDALETCLNAREPAAIVVAIPVKNEQDRLNECLAALADQIGAPPFRVLLLLNDCTDRTESLARRARNTLPLRLDFLIHRFAPGDGGAGPARRLAMQHAARLIDANGVLLTTDADGRAAPNWIAANLAAMRAGADAVAGRAVIDPDEAATIPHHLHEDDARECAYADLLDELEARLDPDPADPWPRHSEHSGASLAVSRDAYEKVGGIPPVPLGEDRAFVTALQSIDARIRHAPEIVVTVSGRLDGRAEGGMADTMRRRIIRQDDYVDDRLEPVARRLRRIAARIRFRAAWRVGVADLALAARLRINQALVATAIQQPFCGAGWKMIERASPLLATCVLRRDQLDRETRRTQQLLHRLRSIRQQVDAV